MLAIGVRGASSLFYATDLPGQGGKKRGEWRPGDEGGNQSLDERARWVGLS